MLTVELHYLIELRPPHNKDHFVTVLNYCKFINVRGD